MPLRDLNGRRRYHRGRAQKQRDEKKALGLTSRGTEPVRLGVDNRPHNRVSLDDMDLIALRDPKIREGR
jgi:hypothetical protein